MNPTPATHPDNQVARPLHVLIPLIKEDLKQGDEAAKQAGMPFYRAAGEKMLEAKNQIKHGEFRPWIKRHFDVSDAQASRYMGLVESENAHARAFSSINEALRESGHKGYMPNKPRPQAWHEPVKEAQVDIDILNRRREALNRADEREAERKLALQLIDIGYKALATKLHPDKGGSRDAMSRLNRVRDHLRQMGV